MYLFREGRPADVIEFDRAPLLSFTDLIISALFKFMSRRSNKSRMFTHVLLTEKRPADVFEFDRTPLLSFTDLIIDALFKFATTPSERC